MEPTIYKPSIYNGAGIYKTGAEGGGGGGGGLQPDEIVIGGQVLGTTQINDQIWTTKNFDSVLQGMTFNPEGDFPTGNYCTYYSRDYSTYGIYGQNRGMLYNMPGNISIIETYLNDNLPGWRIPTKNDWDKLISFAGGENNAMPKLCAKRLWTNASNFTDDFGLSLIPTGRRFGQPFQNLGTGFYWTKTIRTGTNYYQCRVGDQSETVITTSYGEGPTYYANAFRFVKDA